MSHFNDNQNKYTNPCFPTSAGRIPTTPTIPITKAQIRTFRAIINDLIKIIPKLFANPSPKKHRGSNRYIAPTKQIHLFTRRYFRSESTRIRHY